MALEVGFRLGRYDITALIGEGGIGRVYRARDIKLDPKRKSQHSQPRRFS